MKKISILGIAAIAVFSASCAHEKEPAPKEIQEGSYTIVAEMEKSVETRTTLEFVEGSGDNSENSGEYKIVWAEGDRLSVLTSDGFTNKEFTLTDGAGTTSGSFTGKMEADEYVMMALYPYNENHSVDDDVLMLPSEYGDVNEDYTPNTNALMIATSMGAMQEESDKKLQFKHLGGVMSLSLKDIPAGAKGVVLTVDKGITGNFSFLEIMDDPQIYAAEAAAANNSITINFKPEDNARSEVFYFPLPVGTYKFKVEYIDSQDEKVLVIDSRKDNEVTRGKLLIMPELAIVAEEETQEVKISFSEIGHHDAKVNIDIPAGAGDFYYYFQPLGAKVANYTEEEAQQKIQAQSQAATSSDNLMSDGYYAAANGSLLAWYKKYYSSNAKFTIGHTIFVALIPKENKSAEDVIYGLVTLKGYALNENTNANVTIDYDPAEQSTTQVKATIVPDAGTSFLYTSTPLTAKEYEDLKGNEEALMKKAVGKGTAAAKTAQTGFSYNCTPNQTFYLVVYAFDEKMEGRIFVQKLESPGVSYNENIRLSLEIKHLGFRYADVMIKAEGGGLKQIRWGYMKKSVFEDNAVLSANGKDLETMMEIAEEQLAVNKTITQRGLINAANLAQDNLYSIENMYYNEDTYLFVIGYDSNDAPTRMVYTLIDLNESDPLANFDAGLAEPTVKNVYYIANSTGYKKSLDEWTNMNRVTDVTESDDLYGMYWLDLDWGSAGEPKRMWLSINNDLNDPSKGIIGENAKQNALEVLKKRSGSAAGSGTAPDFYGRSTSTGALSLSGAALTGTTEYATLRNKKTSTISAKTLYIVWETADGKYGYMTVVPEQFASIE